SGVKVSVAPYSPSMNGTGRLSITANEITVESGASIDATGVGYPGAGGTNGQCGPPGSGCGVFGAMVGVPGSGGGFFASGGDGTSEATAGTCNSFGGQSPGGQAFFDMAMKTLSLGSAGGAGNAGSSAAGGKGGGIIELAAGKMTIDGALHADGLP